VADWGEEAPPVTDDLGDPPDAAQPRELGEDEEEVPVEDGPAPGADDASPDAEPTDPIYELPMRAVSECGCRVGARESGPAGLRLLFRR